MGARCGTKSMQTATPTLQPRERRAKKFASSHDTLDIVGRRLSQTTTCTDVGSAVALPVKTEPDDRPA